MIDCDKIKFKRLKKILKAIVQKFKKRHLVRLFKRKTQTNENEKQVHCVEK